MRVPWQVSLQKADVAFVAADMPEANEMVVGLMAVVAQAERQMISARTKAALAAAKARGVKLGRPENLREASRGRKHALALRVEKARQRAVDLIMVFRDVQASGAVSLRSIAEALNCRGIPASRGGKWSAVQVKRVLSLQT
jgi:DNA invertase Pin-like site-specific DNA recombinase